MEGSMPLRYRNEGNETLLAAIDRATSRHPGRALDCGCGAADNARALAERGWRLTGVTNDPDEAVEARRWCVDVHLADLTRPLSFAPTGSFDLVVMSHVLEHLPDPAVLLDEAARVLAPGGLIAVALPNIAHYAMRLHLLRGRFEYADTGTLDRTHLRFYTVSSGARLITERGFELVDVRGDGGLPWWRSRSVVPASVRRRADDWAARRFPDLFSWQGVYVASGPAELAA